MEIPEGKTYSKHSLMDALFERTAVHGKFADPLEDHSS